MKGNKLKWIARPEAQRAHTIFQFKSTQKNVILRSFGEVDRNKKFDLILRKCEHAHRLDRTIKSTDTSLCDVVRPFVDLVIIFRIIFQLHFRYFSTIIMFPIKHERLSYCAPRHFSFFLSFVAYKLVCIIALPPSVPKKELKKVHAKS